MPTTQDRLLKSTAVAIKVTGVLVCAFFLIALIALPVLILGNEMLGIASAYQHFDRGYTLLAVPLAGGVVVAMLLLLILRRLRKIVDTAIIRDPFVPGNARLLRQIGWLVLAINAAVFAKLLVLQELISAVRPGISLLARLGFILAQIPWLGLFAALLIFVLAQVFRRGSDMRADLEGTV